MRGEGERGAAEPRVEPPTALMLRRAARPVSKHEGVFRGYRILLRLTP
jgi:hypothetical protein